MHLSCWKPNQLASHMLQCSSMQVREWQMRLRAYCARKTERPALLARLTCTLRRGLCFRCLPFLYTLPSARSRSARSRSLRCRSLQKGRNEPE